MALAVVTKSFRLTAKEYEEFKVLRGWRYRYDWSEVIKGALKDALETKDREFHEPKPLFKMLEVDQSKEADQVDKDLLIDVFSVPSPEPKSKAKKPATPPAKKAKAKKPATSPAVKVKPSNTRKEKVTNGNS
jgi:hypothetical protein